MVVECKDHNFQPAAPPNNRLHIPQENWNIFTQTVHDQVLHEGAQLLKEKSVDHMAATVQAIIINAARLAATTPIKHKRKPNHWFDPRIIPLIKDKHNAHKKAKLQPTQENLAKAKHLTNQVKQEIRNAKRESWSNLIRKINRANNPKSLWQLVQRSLGSTRPPGIPTFPAKDNTPQSKLDLLNQHFSTMGKPEQMQHHPPPAINQAHHHQLLNPVSSQEVTQRIHQLDKNKATGQDGITNAMLQHLPKNMIQVIAQLFTLSWQESKFPTIWKQAIIHPIPKKTPAATPNDYRPISLLPTLGKVLEAITTARLQKYITDNNKLTPHQHGFKKATSTTHALLKYVNSIQQHITGEDKPAQ